MVHGCSTIHNSTTHLYGDTCPWNQYFDFFMISAIGNPIEILLVERSGVTPAVIENVKRYYRLNRSLIEQYIAWLGNVVQLDFGISIIYNQPVKELLVTWGWETMKTQVTAILISLAIGCHSTFSCCERAGNGTGFTGGLGFR